MSIISVDILKKNIPFYNELLEVEKKLNAKVFIVGGAVRDLYMGEDIKDVDITVENVDYSIFAKEFSKIIKTKLIPFKDNYRIVKRGSELDISVLRGKNIYEDTSLRDFTINNMAVSLDGSEIINKETDILNKKIKAVYNKTFDADPIRIIRGFRFASTLSFEIEEDTLKLMVEKKELLKKVAKERVLMELKKMFLGDNLEYSLKMLIENDILREFVSYKNLDFKKTIDLHSENMDQIKLYLKENNVDKEKEKKLKKIIKENKDFPIMLCLFTVDMDFINFLGLSVKEEQECISYKKADYELLKDFLEKKKERELKKFVFFNKLNIVKIAIYLYYKYKDARLFVTIIDIYESIEFEKIKYINGNLLIKMGIKPSPIFSIILKEVMFALATKEIEKDEIENFIVKNFSNEIK